jgi:addiction module HigA family antidote
MPDIEATMHGIEEADHSACHPGALLHKHVLPALNITVSQAAHDLAITRQTLHRILAGKAAITPEMAARLERFCGVSSRFWLTRQHEHDLQLVEAAKAALLLRIPARSLSEAVRKEMGADGR